MGRFGGVEKEMMDNIFEESVLRATVPRIGDVIDGAEHLRNMHEEIGTLGKFTNAAGFTPDRAMQRVAKIDTNIMLMVEELHKAGCTCGNGLWGKKGHKQWVYDWLAGPGRMFDVRGKVDLGQQR
jgi:hypothetical protein